MRCRLIMGTLDSGEEVFVKESVELWEVIDYLDVWEVLDFNVAVLDVQRILVEVVFFILLEDTRDGMCDVHYMGYFEVGDAVFLSCVVGIA